MLKQGKTAQTDINRPPGSSISDLNMDPCQAERFHSKSKTELIQISRGSKLVVIHSTELNMNSLHAW